MPAASGQMFLKLTSSLGSCQGYITPTHHQHQHHPLFFSVSASSFLTLEPLTVSPQPLTSPRAHPRTGYPPFIFTLNLVLLSGLRLNTPSEISHFKKIHEQLDPPCCKTAAITGFFADTAWRLQRLRDSKQNQVYWSSDKQSYREGAFAKTLCDMMIGRQPQIVFEYGCNCLCL